jgi:hypothetical protein
LFLVPEEPEAKKITQNQNKQTLWPGSASELYRPSVRRLSAKLVPTFAVRGCQVVSGTDPYDRILGFLNLQKITQVEYFSLRSAT